MSRFRFLHAADLHLDSPMHGVAAGLPAALAEQVRDASLSALDRLVELALDQQVQFVLLAGDLYDGPTRGVRAQVRLAAALQRLNAAGIDVLIVLGNHDPLESTRQSLVLGPRTTLFGADAVTQVEVRRGEQLLATIHGISFRTRATHENLAARFRRVGDGFEIGLLHAALEGASADHSPYAPCRLADLQHSRLDYWALGHIHAGGVLSASSPTVVYPGCTQGRSFKPSECGPKGAWVVEVERGRLTSPPQFHPIDAVRFLEAAVDIGALDSPPALCDRLISAGEKLAAEHPQVTLLVRARLQGRGPLNALLAESRAIPQLLATLRESQPERDGRLFWCGLIDRTEPALNLTQLAGRGDLTACVIDAAQQADLTALLNGVRAQIPAGLAPVLSRDSLWPQAEPQLLSRALSLALSKLLETNSR
jgi:predicted phosphodiesterase